MVVLCTPSIGGVTNVRYFWLTHIWNLFDVSHFLPLADLSLLLAGAAALEEVRPGVHGGAPVARAHAQHQELGLQDQQEGETWSLKG